MDRTPVSSSNIRSIGYESNTAVLEVEFNSGDIYQYTGVPVSLYEGIMNADSKGKYLSAHVKGVFPYHRVR